MKVALFGAGDIGLHQLPGEHPEGELEDLLGGETEMVPINRRLTLVTRRDGEAERLTSGTPSIGWDMNRRLLPASAPW